MDQTASDGACPHFGLLQGSQLTGEVSKAKVLTERPRTKVHDVSQPRRPPPADPPKQHVKSHRRNPSRAAVKMFKQNYRFGESSQDSILYRDQGDPIWNEDERKRIRRNLRFRPAVIRELLLFWYTQQNIDMKHGLLRKDYVSFHMLVTKALCRNFNVHNAIGGALRDWTRDVGPTASGMTKEQFMDSIFEIVDLWTETVEESEYVGFLRALFLQIARKIQHNNRVTYRWRALNRIQSRVSAYAMPTTDNSAPISSSGVTFEAHGKSPRNQISHSRSLSKPRSSSSPPSSRGTSPSPRYRYPQGLSEQPSRRKQQGDGNAVEADAETPRPSTQSTRRVVPLSAQAVRTLQTQLSACGLPEEELMYVLQVNNLVARGDSSRVSSQASLRSDRSSQTFRTQSQTTSRPTSRNHSRTVSRHTPTRPFRPSSSRSPAPPDLHTNPIMTTTSISPRRKTFTPSRQKSPRVVRPFSSSNRGQGPSADDGRAITRQSVRLKQRRSGRSTLPMSQHAEEDKEPVDAGMDNTQPHKGKGSEYGSKDSLLSELSHMSERRNEKVLDKVRRAMALEDSVSHTLQQPRQSVVAHEQPPPELDYLLSHLVQEYDLDEAEFGHEFQLGGVGESDSEPEPSEDSSPDPEATVKSRNQTPAESGHSLEVRPAEQSAKKTKPEQKKKMKKRRQSRPAPPVQVQLPVLSDSDEETRHHRMKLLEKRSSHGPSTAIRNSVDTKTEIPTSMLGESVRSTRGTEGLAGLGNPILGRRLSRAANAGGILRKSAQLNSVQEDESHRVVVVGVGSRTASPASPRPMSSSPRACAPPHSPRAVHTPTSDHLIEGQHIATSVPKQAKPDRHTLVAARRRHLIEARRDNIVQSSRRYTDLSSSDDEDFPEWDFQVNEFVSELKQSLLPRKVFVKPKNPPFRPVSPALSEDEGYDKVPTTELPSVQGVQKPLSTPRCLQQLPELILPSLRAKQSRIEYCAPAEHDTYDNALPALLGPFTTTSHGVNLPRTARVHRQRDTHPRLSAGAQTSRSSCSRQLYSKVKYKYPPHVTYGTRYPG